ncbi:MAG: hypothetical protein JO294_02665 [Alphaproteobacteria bacterium]|nr:hypothetical protein [Alphaproteobacteria bacterium]
MKTFAFAVLMVSATVFSTAAIAAAPREYTRVAEETAGMNPAQICEANAAACVTKLNTCIRAAGGNILLQRRCDSEREDCEANACNPPAPATTGETAPTGTTPAPSSGL